MQHSERSYLRRTPLVVALVALLLVGLPVAVWLDLRHLSETSLLRQVGDLNDVISGIRSFYASDVVGRVLAGHGHTVTSEKYEAIPGAIPIPATFSLELGRVVREKQSNITYRFVSDYPFRHRAAHELDPFERSSLDALRTKPAQLLSDVSWNGLDNRVRIISPIIMGQTCVACHNTHPDSPKRDWKIGDVRGIQELIVVSPVATNIFSFRYLLLYLLIAAASGVAFITLQARQSSAIARSNAFLASVSQKLSRYLAPQVFRSIFSGERDVAIATERKKLTIFFSDIKNFTSTSERLQPEELTALLNEYFTAMSAVATEYGGTIDKFIGDAMLIFFGDPETKGIAEDARACVRMALAMQTRLAELNVAWRSFGFEEPFLTRMGINTGYCNVGNFGSNDRMDYTIIGAEANLAARLEAIAEPGQIVLSYETFAHVRDMVVAHQLAPVRMKGIPRDVVPYAIDRALDGAKRVVAERAPGIDLYLDPQQIDSTGRERVRTILRRALDSLDAPPPV